MRLCEKDYEEMRTALAAAHHKRERLDAQILILDKRIRALEMLIEHDPQKGRVALDGDTTSASAMVSVPKPTMTATVRSLLTFANVPLTAGEICEKFKE